MSLKDITCCTAVYIIAPDQLYDEVRRSVRDFGANHSAATNTHATEKNRDKNIIIRNMVYRENENVKRRVNGLIQD